MVTMRTLRRPFTSLPAMLMLFGALLVVQFSAEAMDGADEVCIDVQWTNLLSFARHVLFHSYSFVVLLHNYCSTRFRLMLHHL